MRLIRCSTLVWLSAYALAPDFASAWSVTPRNAVAIDTTAVPGMTELSGAVYRGALGGSMHELNAVQDSGDQLVTLSFGLSANGTLTSAAATATRALSPGFDFEGLALGPAGSVLVADENTPAIRRYDETTGAATATLAMPVVFNSNRPNFAFESLTRAPDGDTYWTANEEALTLDGAPSDTSHGTTVRLQRFGYDASGTLALGPQYAYAVDPIHIGTTTDSRTRSGLVDLVALPDSTLLTLERSLGIFAVVFGIPLYQYEDRIYRVTVAGATDTSQSPYDAGLIGQSYTPATKTLLWKGQVGGGFGQNMEGLAFGPQLSGGDWSLLGVVDNSGGTDPLSNNTLAAFSLSPSIPGDFNGNGTVDAADCVIWRNDLGMIFTPSDYDTYRAHFGQSELSGSAVATAATLALPEATTLRMLLIGLLPLFHGRIRSSCNR